MKKMIIMGAGALLLVGVSVGATLFLTGGDEPPPGDPAAATEEGETAPAEPEMELPLIHPMEVHYYNVQPEFVVNFQNKSKQKFLMVEMTVAVREEDVLAVIDDHIPELRNNVLLLLAEQDSTMLKTGAGKNALREQATEIFDGLVTKHYGPGRVIDVYFTRFVMQ